MKAGKDQNKPLVVESTKQCPCGNGNLLKLRSLNRKVCTDCDTWLLWEVNKDEEMIA